MRLAHDPVGTSAREARVGDRAPFHYAIDGLMLDRLTVPLDTGLSVDDAVNEYADRTVV